MGAKIKLAVFADFKWSGRKGLLQQPGIIDNWFGSPRWRKHVSETDELKPCTALEELLLGTRKGLTHKAGCHPQIRYLLTSQHLKLAAMLKMAYQK